MNHPVQMVLIGQVGLVKTNEQQVVKVTGLLLEFRNDRDIPPPASGKLIA